MNQPQNKLLFMSQQHVNLMNQRLAADSASLQICKGFDRAYQVAYELDRDGATVWWTMEFDPASGVRFSLQPPRQDDSLVLLKGSYRVVVDVSRRTKAGETIQMPLAASGNLGVFEIVKSAFAAAQKAAAIDTEFPEV